MASILIIGDTRTHSSWAGVLERDGHSVEVAEHSLSIHDRFAGDPVDIFIVDIMNADWGEAMLIPQARATWPECRTIAVASSYAFRSSAIFQMGLWTPDQLLIKPVNPRVLSATVGFLWAQIKIQRIRKLIEQHPVYLDSIKEPEIEPETPQHLA